MTTLVSLLFIAMIPIDYKTTKFSLHLSVCFVLVSVRVCILNVHECIYTLDALWSYLMMYAFV